LSLSGTTFEKVMVSLPFMLVFKKTVKKI